MKKQLFIFSIFFLDSVHCKTPKEPNLPVRSMKMPRFIGFDDTQAILNFRLQDTLDEEIEMLLQEITREITRNDAELEAIRETRRNNEEIERRRLAEQERSAEEGRRRQEEVRKLLESESSAESVKLCTHEIARYEKQIHYYDSFWFTLDRLITPLSHQWKRNKAIEDKEKAIQKRSDILLEFIKPYAPQESQFSAPIIAPLSNENFEKVSLKTALKKYSDNAPLRE